MSNNCGIVVVDDRRDIVVADCGTQGPPGPGGGGGGSSYDYIRDTPAATWVIDHNLGHRVHVTLLDATGQYVLAQVDQAAPWNQVTVTYPAPVTGSAHLS